MSNCGNCGAPSNVNGAGHSPGELDTYGRQPKVVWSGTAAPTDVITVPTHGWLDFGGSFGAGWTVQLGQDTAIPVAMGFMCPAPPAGQLNIKAAGAGTLTILHHPEEVGRVLGAGRSFGAGGSSSNPKATPTADDDGHTTTPAAGGTQLTGGVLAAGGATSPCTVIVSGDQNNALGTFLARTQATAAARACSPVYAAGEIEYVIPAGGKLWAASADGAQVIYWRIRQ